MELDTFRNSVIQSKMLKSSLWGRGLQREGKGVDEVTSQHLHLLCGLLSRGRYSADLSWRTSLKPTELLGMQS